MPSSHLLIATCLISTALAAVGPTADLTLTNAEVAPDGFPRQAVLVNGQIPGPLIVANKSDMFNLNVIDRLTNETMLLSTSIHWHGFLQPNNSWADGVAMVTQCPIATNHSFLYTFPTHHQAGTFWYHSHLSVQYCDGLSGPLVVYDPHDPHASLYDVDDESTVITLQDWYHEPVKTLMNKPGQAGPPILVSTLINGLGRSSSTPASKLAVISVTSGKRYRMRLVSMSCGSNFIFAIDGHIMTIIEADGVNTEPLTVDSIQIYTGQRYSFILTANKQVDNYWIRTIANGGATSFKPGWAILRYMGANHTDPTTKETTSTAPLVETDLHPFEKTAVPGNPVAGGADRTMNLVISFNNASKSTPFEINGAAFTNPPVPVLLQILSSARSATDLLPLGSVFTLPPNSVVDLSIPGGSPGSPHPFHLHGHTFFVIRSAGSDTYNFHNPVVRDVVNTGKSPTDNTTIRFVTDNAGPWILHCHIDFHLEQGLALVFVEDKETIANSKQPAEWHDLCPIYDALPPHEL